MSQDLENQPVEEPGEERKLPDMAAAALFFKKIRQGYTIYGCYSALMAKGYITPEEGKLRQQQFGESGIDNFPTLLALLGEDVPNLAQWLAYTSWYKPNPRGAIEAALLGMARAVGNDITPEIRQYISEKAAEYAEGARDLFDVYKNVIEDTVTSFPSEEQEPDDGD